LWILDAWAGVGEKNHNIPAVANGLDGQHAALGRFHGVNPLLTMLKNTCSN